MNLCEDPLEKLSLWIRIRRRLVRYFLAHGTCNGSCDECSKCPWIDKEKYTFEIRKKKED